MQWQFDFKDLDEALELFYRRKGGGEDLVFVISTASYTSGYWVEPSEGAEDGPHTKVYRTVAEVKRLERRIRRERAKTVNLSLGGLVT